MKRSTRSKKHGLLRPTSFGVSLANKQPFRLATVLAIEMALFDSELKGSRYFVWSKGTEKLYPNRHLVAHSAYSVASLFLNASHAVGQTLKKNTV